MEEGDDGSLELGALLRADGDRGERPPQDVLANVRSDEQRDARAETVTFLEELIEEDHDHSCCEELHKDQNSIEGAEIRQLAVHATE